MSSVETLISIGVPVFDDIFVAYPELGSFLLVNGVTD